METSNWRIFTMDEVWDLLNPNGSKLAMKPNFPTRRWGNITTKTSTTDKESLEKAIEVLRQGGMKVRKRIDHEATKKHTLKFYKIEVKGEIKEVNHRDLLKDFVSGFYEWHSKSGYATIKKEDWSEYIDTLYDCEHNYTDGTGTGYNVCLKCNDMN